jgi:hypothetical protein
VRRRVLPWVLVGFSFATGWVMCDSRHRPSLTAEPPPVTEISIERHDPTAPGDSVSTRYTVTRTATEHQPAAVRPGETSVILWSGGEPAGRFVAYFGSPR